MGRYDGVLLLSDYDGTLRGTEGVSTKDSEAIREFQRGGGLFALSSGRLPSLLPKCSADFIPNTWCPMCNGAVLCTPDGASIVFERRMNKSVLPVVREIVRQCPQMTKVMFYEDTVISLLPDELTNAQEPPVDTYHKIVFAMPNELSDGYFKIIRDVASASCFVSRSWMGGIEIQSPGTSKGDALQRLRRMLGDRVSLTVAVGDNDNDKEMIRVADIGYAVGNAAPDVKAVADRITVSCNENAICRIISEL